jgi:RNA polymerase sigma factor (sigma-70 family)
MTALSLSNFPAPRLHRRGMALYDGSITGTFFMRRGGAARRDMAFQSNQFMTRSTDRADPAQGIEGVLLANRDRIIRFLQVRGAGENAEDLFQDLWMRLTERATGPIADPLSYAMRAANNLMLDRYRSARQRAVRDQAWSEASDGHEPSAEASLISRQQLEQVQTVIAATGERPAHIFRRFRVDGASQRDIAQEMGLSLSTIEADLRKVYAALAALRRQFDAG